VTHLSQSIYQLSLLFILNDIIMPLDNPLFLRRKHLN
jgi:hypothetical protein